jgi:hypothetical protein
MCLFFYGNFLAYLPDPGASPGPRTLSTEAKSDKGNVESPTNRMCLFFMVISLLIFPIQEYPTARPARVSYPTRSHMEIPQPLVGLSHAMLSPGVVVWGSFENGVLLDNSQKCQQLNFHRSEVSPLVIGIRGACFKRHPSRADAEAAMKAARDSNGIAVIDPCAVSRV